MIQNPIPWPDGAKCACAITFDMDADSLIHISKPKDGYNRLYPITMGKYGPLVGVPRILETYKRLGLKQSFFVPGWCIERYQETVEKIVKDGHEIGHHGYLHEDPTQHSADEQSHWFNRALEVHKKIIGKSPRGYRGPVYNITHDVIDELIKNEFDYDSSLMGDDIPYLMKTKKGQLYEVPVHWGTDDWPPFAHYEEINYMMPVRSPSMGLAGFFEEFDAHYAAGGLWMPILHPFLTGRLARWYQFEKWLERTLSEKNVWFATLEEVVGHVKSLVDNGEYKPRVDVLPYYHKPVLLDE